jgi:hypothetical protein
MKRFLLFQTDQVDIENPALDLCISLQSNEVTIEGDLQAGRTFTAQYHKDHYSIHFEQVPELRSLAFVIDARRGVATNSFYKGFYQLIENWITQHDAETLKTIEYFTAPDLALLIKNRADRYMSQQILTDYAGIHEQDNKAYEAVSLDYKEIGLNLGDDRCIKATASLKGVDAFIAWKAICVKREFDNWDMTTWQFLPLTTAEANTELEEFEKEYRLKSCLPEGFKEGDKILRLAKGYGLSFLVLREESLMFFEYDLSHS